MVSPTRTGRLGVGELAATMSQELDAVARLLTDRIHGHLPELDDDLYAMNLHSVRSNLGMLMKMLRHEADPAKAH